MNSQGDKSANLSSAEYLIDQLANAGAEFIMLPEFFLFLGDMSEVHEQAEPVDGPSLERIRKKAQHHKVYIHSGSFPESDGDKVYNTALVFNPDGELIAKYRKLHMFDVEIPGGLVIRESDSITPGSEIVTFKIGDATFGLTTCYDLRFPELYRHLAMQGAQVLLVPSAFTLATGRDHWELLLRARAVENLCWVAAAGQWGSSPPDHLSYGRSMVVNPWGLVVAQAPDGVCCVTADIDLNLMKEIRTRFPALDHVREDLFTL